MIYAIVSVLLCALILGSTSISGGIMLGLVIATGLSVIFTQFPNWLKSFIIKFRLILDFGISAGVFFALNSDTVTGLVGAATCGLLITLLLHHQATKRSGGSTLATDAQSLMRAVRSA